MSHSDGVLLFAVVVHPAALADHPSDKDRQVHREIVRTLQAHGILSVGGDEAEGLMSAIEALGDDSRSLWSGLLHMLYDNNRLDRTSLVAPVEEVVRDFESLKDLGMVIRLLVASQAEAAKHAVGFHQGSRTVNGTDMVIAATIDRSPAVEAASRLGSFEPGTARDVVGEAVLRPLARRSHSTTVFDPHLFDDILGTARGGRPRDHVEWLVEQLAAGMPTDSMIRLIGDFPTQRRGDGEPLDRTSARELIDAAVSVALTGRSQPLTVEVTLVQGPRRNTKSSNRYVMFSCGFSYNVTHDILRLGSRQIPSPDPLALNRLDAEQTQLANKIAEEYRGYLPATARLQWEIAAPASRADL